LGVKQHSKDDTPARNGLSATLHKGPFMKHGASGITARKQSRHRRPASGTSALRTRKLMLRLEG
jgi:hypothetical protein